MIFLLQGPISIPFLLAVVCGPYLALALLNGLIHYLSGLGFPKPERGIDVRLFYTVISTILHGTVWLVPIVAPILFIFYGLVTLGWILPKKRNFSRKQIAPMFFINATLMILLPIKIFG